MSNMAAGLLIIDIVNTATTKYIFEEYVLGRSILLKALSLAAMLLH